MIDYFK